MTRLVCLANSERPGGQCVAGIDLDSGEWIRPIPRDVDAIPTARCLIGGKFLTLLDIIEVDLVRPRDTPRFQRENRIIKTWDWSIVGRFRKSDLASYCDNSTPILHSTDDRVSPRVLERLSPLEWASLQLVKPRKLRFEHDYWDERRWRARLEDAAGNEYYLKITDATITRRLESGDQVSSKSLLTVSLAKPWAPRDGSKPELCYKIVAAVIEL
ncbi:MAG TPA: hypothetical protein VMP01_20480 [Pirellulaceae bacterium]|nr:hypothetical protein [Pirellulaceae bacterium]